MNEGRNDSIDDTVSDDSEIKLRQSLEMLPEAVIIINQDACILYANSAFSNIVGEDIPSIVEKTLYEIIDETDQEIVQEKIDGLFMGNSSCIELSIRTKNNQKKWIRVSSIPRVTPKSEIHAIAIVIDITEREQYMEILERTTKNLRQTIREQVCLYSSSKLLTDPNRIIEDVLYQLAHLIPTAYQYPDDTVVKITCEGITEQTENFMRTEWCQYADVCIIDKKVGTIQVCLLKDYPDEFEGPFRKQERILLDSLADALGGYLGRKRDKEELERTTREIICLRTVTQALSNTDSSFEDTFFQVVNLVQGALQYPHLANVRITFEGFTVDIQLVEDEEHILSKELKVFGERCGFIEVTYPKTIEIPDGELDPFLNQEEDLLDAVALELNLYIERRKNEEMKEQQRKELEIYSSLLRHDVGNDLQLIQGYIDMIEMITVGEKNESSEMLKSARAVCERMSSLLKAFSRKADSIERNIANLIRTVSMKAEAAEVDLKINIDIEEQAKNLRIPGSRLLPAVFENLYRNAVAYAGDEPVVTVTVTKAEDNVRIVVSDNGPGISPEIKDKLFQRGASTTGGGLGLFLSRNIIKALGGSLKLISSEENAGATFEILIPISV
ncbi:MAG: PAS domain S-box protein [Candidatus Lokiarchaeota archaeon]|nr:PAS domain S-box protein [Candidatus Lokiarchaeota archaeon]